MTAEAFFAALRDWIVKEDGRTSVAAAELDAFRAASPRFKDVGFDNRGRLIAGADGPHGLKKALRATTLLTWVNGDPPRVALPFSASPRAAPAATTPPRAVPAAKRPVSRRARLGHGGRPRPRRSRPPAAGPRARAGRGARLGHETPARRFDVPALSAEEAARHAFLALKRKLQPCTKGAMELDEPTSGFGRTVACCGRRAPRLRTLTWRPGGPTAARGHRRFYPAGSEAGDTHGEDRAVGQAGEEAEDSSAGAAAAGQAEAEEGGRHEEGAAEAQALARGEAWGVAIEEGQIRLGRLHSHVNAPVVYYLNVCPLFPLSI